MWSNRYIGIPFEDKGRTDQGCDCWGLVRLVYQRELGFELPSLLDYSDTKDSKTISKMIRQHQDDLTWLPVETQHAQPFDVCVFRMVGVAAHVGIVVKNGLMLHCQRGSCTVHDEYLRDSNWSKRLEGIYRHAAHSDRSFTV